MKEDASKAGDELDRAAKALRLPPAVAELVRPELRRALLELRRRLHAHPEPSGAEHDTQRALRTALEAGGVPEIREVAGTGLLARVPGSDLSAPPVAVRGDMDALPILEQTGLAYASRDPGLMHACGHDVHASWAVGAALLLSRRPAAGDVLIVLQPAEERAEGARAVLESGALDAVAAIFGAHVDRGYPVGTVVAQSGPLAASADFFEIRLNGAGGHGARPHETRDPLAAGAALVTALYAALPRRMDPDRPTVMSLGSFQAGDASNVIPDRAVLRGTIRATLPADRDRVVEEVRAVTEAVARVHRVEAAVDVRSAVPPLVNDDRASGWARSAADALLGPERVVPLASRNMAGEDFAFYAERIPACFLRVGAREEGGPFIPTHSPRFYAAEEAIFVGAVVLAEAARTASEALARPDERR